MLVLVLLVLELLVLELLVLARMIVRLEKVGRREEIRKEEHISHYRAWTACRDSPQTRQIQFRQR